MSNDKIRRKIVWEKSGVSEIIGTILMLAITVVLFSSIITFVGTMPAPKQTFVVDLNCSVLPVNGTWDQADFRILHEGGQVIEGVWVEIYITVDNQIVTRNVDDGLVDANADGMWGVGEWWVNRVSNTEATTLSDTSDFTITIVDQEKNMLIWYETIGEGVNNYAPIIKRAWIDSDLATPAVDDYGPISYEATFKIYAEIEDPEGIGGVNGLNKSNLWVDVSEINSTSPPLQLSDMLDTRDAANDNIYVAYCDGPIGTGAYKIPVGYYYFFFSAFDESNRTANPFAAMFPVGMIVGEKPQIVVKGDNPTTGKYEYITFSNPEPTNGDTISITATILNLGAKGANVDVWFYLDVENATTLIPGSPKTVLVPEVGQQDATISWKASPGGLHRIIVNATVRDTTSEFYDPDLTDNMNYTNISVMPKMLLVDDDGHVNDLSDGDTTSFMRASLEAADFKYDFVTVGSGDGPGYEYGDYPLVEYDVVIWMTGYRTVKTLTVGTGSMATRTDDVANLQKFLTGSPTGVPVEGLNGGSLWLISQGFWDEAATTPSLNTFATGYLHINPMPTTAKVALPSELYGNASHPVTDYFADTPINTVERVAGTGNVNYWRFLDYPGERIALNDTAADLVNMKAYALTYDSDDEGADTLDSRILAQTWGFSRIKDTATQAQFAYKAILWLGNITSKFTQDIAISEQTIEPETVFYKQQVTIKFVVRNNGLTNYTTGDNLWWLLRIMDMNGNDLILPHLQRIDFLGMRANNTLELNYSWTPQEIGYHRISIKIDPYNYISESNELNNEISSYWGTGELNVLYRVLVVDDDGSANNLGGLLVHNETADLTGALDFLEYDYELYVVNVTENGPAYSNGENTTALSEYNAVIWVVGSAVNPLTSYPYDVHNLTQYLELGGNLWLLGDGMWTAGDEVVSSFEQSYLKINSVDGDQGMPATLEGVEDDTISHGIAYDCNAAAGADILLPAAGGTGFTYQDAADGDFNSARYYGVGNTSVKYRSAVTAWPLSSLDQNLSRAEFAFMMLRWFEKPEERIEVRIADIDIWVSDDHPQLGSGYVIQAQVQNTGGSTGNVLVRFMDGNTQIGSDSISVSANSWTTAEIIWVPLFAGQRTINVLLDPILEVPEIFAYSGTGWTNNIATRPIYVFFFWDNMQSGASKWSHSSTIALINGEGPLEYFGSTAVTIGIEDEWDYPAGNNVTNCTDPGFYHTFDTSTWLQEPSGAGTTTGERPPLDVVFALDNSGSMSDTDIANLIDAAQQFIGQLADEDRAAIWTYGNQDYDYDYDQDGEEGFETDPRLLEDWEYMTGANRAVFNNSLDTLDNDNWGTPFYDTLGEAVAKALEFDADASDDARFEYVIGMTDGESNSDEAWTPNRNWGTAGWETDYGVDKNKKGLLYAPCMIYTVGLGIGHDDNDGGWIYPTAPDWSHIPPHDGTPAEEYDLWNVADTSPSPLNDAGGVYGENATTGDDNVGHYYYTTDSSQLPSIFDAIFESIIQANLTGEPQTRSSGDGDETLDLTTYTFAGVTQATNDHYAFFNDMDDSSAAELSNPNSRTEFTNAYYTAASTTNNAYAGPSGDPGNNQEMGVEYRFRISQNAWDVTQLDLTHEARYSAAETVTIFAWNANTLAWDTIGGTQAYAINTDVTMTRSIAANAQNYIGSGYLRWIAYPSARATVQVDFAKVDVTYTPSGSSPAAPVASPSPASGAIGVPVTMQYTISFSKQMNNGFGSVTIAPAPATAGAWAWSANGMFYNYTGMTWTASTMYTMGVSGFRDTTALNMQAYTWTFTTAAPNQPTATPAPADGATGVSISTTYVISFSKQMNNAVGTVAFTPAPSGGAWAWSANRLFYNFTGATWALSTLYNVALTAFLDTQGVSLTNYQWEFTTGEGTSSGGDTPGLSPPGNNCDKSAVTKAMDLRDLSSATLEFWHKYNIVPGANGGVLMIGFFNETAAAWQYKYVVPSSAYTGNLRLNDTARMDSFNTFIQWGWNGISGRGTFTWEKVNLNVLPYLTDIDPDWLDEVRIKFQYYQYGAGTGYGWYIDDVRMTVSRPNTAPTATSQDVWQMVTVNDRYGNPTTAWWNGNVTNGLMRDGIDNYLMSSPIDLTNARTAYLSAYVKFNLNYASGAPPDGFRVEITTDNGVSWKAVNLGVRSAWNVSGTDGDAEDGIIDGKSYTGIDEGNYWVNMGTLTRVNVDLSAFSGNAIHIRFRVVNNGDAAYIHSDTAMNPGFGGFYLDDVQIMGETILG